MRVLLVEGPTDAKFLAGLLGINDLNTASMVAQKIVSGYRCYSHKDVLICEGGGKYNVCKRAIELDKLLTEKKYNFEVYVLLDGDAKEIECDVGDTFHLNSRNLEELVFLSAFKVLSTHDYALHLLEKEKDNADSKLKAYLLMYLIKKYEAPGENWTDISSFLYFVGKTYKEQLLSHDESLHRLFELLSNG
ncbi:hypothetical protein [Stygiolobus caldivivus]|uniref:Uncharacterized protein n=1 Tax=Stygiolobus caldivivus TaxID=2824673 RepID=A0A8D5U5S4_9CREN|nr:hypothetical protein [Stygiolobus caldivivus]BCU70016.1 hypothetical protein KN1_13130 [Stygiolobus caldivivus]